MIRRKRVVPFALVCALVLFACGKRVFEYVWVAGPGFEATLQARAALFLATESGYPLRSMLLSILSLLVGGLGILYWGYQLMVLRRVERSVDRVADLPREERAFWPRVSVIMTACNEEAALEEAVRARLADDYPDLELILINDRSTDSTPEIADRLAAVDPRIRVCHITELPEGWLGKVNALNHGVGLSTGDWILFSDGDVSVHPGALTRIIAYCERRGIDHCAALPSLRSVNPLLDCMTSAFMRLVALKMKVWEVEDPASPTAVGVGAFNLIRRSALQRSPGLEWLRLEVGDDLCLGEMLKACGSRQYILHARGTMSVQFHASVADSFKSAERATYTSIGNFSLPRLAAMSLIVLLVELSWLISLALARSWFTAGVALAALGFAIAAMIVSNRFHGRSSWNLFLTPVTTLLVALSILRAGVLGAVRGGIVWRGTFYPNAKLRAGRRYGKAWAKLRSWREGQDTEAA